MICALYSDLHLEFNNPFAIPKDTQKAADILILAGDIISFEYPEALLNLVKTWDKPILFVAGNHEYYNNRESIADSNQKFRDFIYKHLPQIYFLDNESITIEGVTFFGGTMWTDFQKGNPVIMQRIQGSINDFKKIQASATYKMSVHDQYNLYWVFRDKLSSFLQSSDKNKPVVVITHYSPIINPDSIFPVSDFTSAFCATGIQDLFYELPTNSLWFYGHTHESDYRSLGDQLIIVSNPYGYHLHQVNKGFDPKGVLITI
jgi:predicted phosphodiesterase